MVRQNHTHQPHRVHVERVYPDCDTLFSRAHVADVHFTAAVVRPEEDSRTQGRGVSDAVAASRQLLARGGQPGYPDSTQARPRKRRARDIELYGRDAFAAASGYARGHTPAREQRQKQ